MNELSEVPGNTIQSLIVAKAEPDCMEQLGVTERLSYLAFCGSVSELPVACTLVVVRITCFAFFLDNMRMPCHRAQIELPEQKRMLVQPVDGVVHGTR